MRLTDCHLDAFAYTLYMLREGAQAARAHDKARQDLAGLLAQADTCGRALGHDDNDLREARFAVCAWIDEAILTSSWPGAAEWRKNQLQREFFGTTNAGVEFFERLEALPPKKQDLIELYGLCLALGFRGRFFPEDQRKALDALKDENLRKIVGELAREQDLAGVKLFPQAYWHKGTPFRRKSFRPFDWYALLIPLVGVLIAVELYLFYRNSLNIQLLEFFGGLR